RSMNRRPHLTLVALIVAGLVGVGLLAVPGSPIHQGPTLGLDLQGGLEVTLQAVPPPNRQLQKADLSRSVSILRDRIDRLGVAEPEIREQGDDQISIQIPGIKNPEQVIGIIGQTAQLELFDLQANLLPPSIDATRSPRPTESLFGLLVRQQAEVADGKTEDWYLFDGKRTVRAGPTSSKAKLLASKVVAEAGEKGKLPDGWRILGVPPKAVVLVCGIGEVVCPGEGEANPTHNSYYLIRFDPSNSDPEKVVPEMTGADLKLSGTRQDFDTTTSQPIVTMQFTDDGADKFARITNNIADRGKALYNITGGGGDPRNSFQNFAIVLDRQIKSWPSIDWEQYPNGISGTNGAQITGIGELDEAKNLALVLQSGALPVTFTTLEQTAISATLGKDSLAEAWKAAIAGLLVVALFLLVFYRVLGVVAVLGLGIYAAFLYAAILVFNVTLTLPGFAGMILTLGVAADANIVIFERVKEEYRAGKSVRAAIAAGYGKGFATIIDANVVTAITAVILFLVATAGVKGFALMLLIGTLMSLLTAVAATRAILGLLGGFRWFDNPRLMGAEGEPPAWIRRDFIGLRNRWFAISGVVLALSVGAIGLNGLNLGIDFEGGTQITLQTPQPASLEAVRAQADKTGQGSAQIQGTGKALEGDKYREFRIRTDVAQVEQTRLTEGLKSAFQAETSVKSVSASFGRQIAEGAILAIIVSLLLV
ncbi:MAG: protein translocase subunit SecD, partial [Actinobacteria bacterium]|nr:protein translocase subunit SecD [Actinomycetota bacterium]